MHRKTPETDIGLNLILWLNAKLYIHKVRLHENKQRIITRKWKNNSRNSRRAGRHSNPNKS